MKKRLVTLMFTASLTASLCACGGEAPPAVDLLSLTMEEITDAARKEGQCESVAMPDDWANWKASWQTISDMYGIEHYDTDMSSSEELAVFEAEKDSPTKDIGDIGHGFVTLAIERDLVQPYKPSTWNSIPDWAKDPEGRWVMSYTGTVAFTVNKQKTGGKIPHSWKELMEGDYVISPGNMSGASSQMMVVSCALANGGSLDNIQPGIDYFKELARQGRIDPGDLTQDRLATGEIEVMAGKYDFCGLAYRDAINDAGGDIEVVIPKDGAVSSGYCLIINKYAPHPHAAALTVEYMLSDAGQIDRARGYARPIRSDVELPDEVQEKMLPDEQYENVVQITDPAQMMTALSEVSIRWEEDVLPLIQ